MKKKNFFPSHFCTTNFKYFLYIPFLIWLIKIQSNKKNDNFKFYIYIYIFDKYTMEYVKNSSSTPTSVNEPSSPVNQKVNDCSSI